MDDPPDKFLIGLIQMSCGSDAEENITKAEAFIAEAAAHGAKLVCLQELFATPYFCQEENPDNFDLAERFDGSLSERMSKVAAQHQVVLIAPYFEKRAEGVFHNSAMVINADGTVLGQYRKMHIPDDPGFYEKYYFAPGDLGFRAWDTAVGRIGVCVCWDQWFPEAARLTAMHGAEILFYPTAIGWLPDEKKEYGIAQHEAWQISQRAHGIANGCYVASVNRTGLESIGERQIEFWGNSFMSGPDGQVIGALSNGEEGVLAVEFDRAAITHRRRGWPFFRDRRIDNYEDLTERFLDGSD